MKKTILLVALLAVITALAYIGCGDSGVQNKNSEITDLLSFFTGGDTRYTLTVNVTPTNGGTASCNPSGTSYKAGSKVAVTATPSNGYRFTGWSGASNDTAATVTITMDDNQTLTANFVSTSAATTIYTLSVNVTPAYGGYILREPNKARYNAGEIVTVTANPIDGYTFSGWTGAVNKTDKTVSITMNGNMTLNANFQQNTYTLSVNANPAQGGTLSRNPQKSAYTYGEEVTVTAMPATGYAFDGYTGAVISTSAGVTIIMDGNKTLTAKFIKQTAPSYTLSTVASPAVATISRNPDKASYQDGETVTVTAPTTEGYTFTGWSGASTSTAASVTITMDDDISLTANYNPIEYTLTIDVLPAVGGTVSRNPNNNTYTYNQSVTVNATPVAGYKFTGWSGVAAAGASTYGTTATVTMNSNKSLTATFEQYVYTLSTYVFPSGTGTVSISPNKNLYTYNEQVTVTATPASGYTFTGWSDAALGMTNPVTIVMIEGRSLTANFQQTLYTLTTNVFPSGGGSVSRSPNQTNYTYGTNVTVTATVVSGYTFTGWSGASTSTSSSVTVTMNEDKTLTANFQQQQANSYTLTTNVSPTGGGSVSRSPNQTVYTFGTSVTITATAVSGYTFNNWTISGGGTIADLGNASTSVTMNGNVTVTANFQQNIVTPPGGEGGTLSYGGQTYRTVRIGNQTWMAENLNYQTASDSWCFANSTDSCKKYGRLYTWNAAKTVCPTGWHLPDTSEWNTLVAVAGGYMTAGSKLKSTIGWDYYCSSICSSSSTDEFGFTALPGGGYRDDPNNYILGNNFGFTDIGRFGYWWTVTDGSTTDGSLDYVYFRMLNDINNGVSEPRKDKKIAFAFSVRCLED